MKNIFLFFLFLSFNLQAESTDETINNACLNQALSLVQKMKAEIYTEMNEEQGKNIIRLSTESCKQQFAAKDTQQIVSQVNEEKSEPGTMDWFTDKILNGDTPDKDGNRRLKRMQRK